MLSGKSTVFRYPDDILRYVQAYNVVLLDTRLTYHSLG